MSQDNPFEEAMDSTEEQQDDSGQQLGEFDLDNFIDALDEGTKSETIGIAVNPELHAVWKELRQADDVDVDVAESIRQHLINLAQRHDRATERAGRKLQIDQEL